DPALSSRAARDALTEENARLRARLEALAPGPDAPKPSRPIPTPGEVFPRRKPAPPPPANPQQLAAG
ncbi:hypothetical protein ABT082_32385, partial [Streptomyces massasporeus]